MADLHVIPAGAVGTELPSVSHLITPRELMAYAAGIGATRETYYSATPQASPAFCVVLEWAVLNGGPYRDLLRADQSQMERAIHTEQASRFHAPLRPGMRVFTDGRISALRQTRTGVLIAVELTTHDRHGSLLVDSRFTALFRDAILEGLGEWEIVAAEWAGPTGEWRPTSISPLTAHIYTACSGIWNPIHTEITAAQAIGLEVPIIHGTWSWAVLMEAAVDRALAGDATKLESWTARFLRPVLPTDSADIATRLGGQTISAYLQQNGELCVRARGMAAVPRLF